MKVARSIGSAFSHGLNAIVKPRAKPVALAGGYALAMDVLTTRHRNLVALVDARTAGGRTKKDAAIDLNLSPSFLSQLLAGKPMGGDLARKIETATGNSHGWMDVPHEGGRVGDLEPASYLMSQPARPTAETLAASIRLVRLACENLDIDFDPESAVDAAIVLLASDYLAARDEHEITVDNVVDFTKRLRARTRAVDGESGGGQVRGAGAGAG